MHIDDIERALKDAVDRGTLDADEVDAAVTRQRVADADLTEVTNEPDSPGKYTRVAEAIDEYNQANEQIASLCRKLDS
jgi:hypothetical protein